MKVELVKDGDKTYVRFSDEDTNNEVTFPLREGDKGHLCFMRDITTAFQEHVDEPVELFV